MVSICSSFNPLVVIAEVPKRNPEVTKGLLVSNGTVFLLIVISHFTKVFSANFPVMISDFGRKSISIR